MRKQRLYIVVLAAVLAAANFAQSQEQAPPPLKERVKVNLDEPFSSFCAGGEGRYLIFHLKNAKKIQLFDIYQAAIVKSIDAPADDLLLAASKEKLVAVVASQKLMHRYSLPDLVREKSAPLGNLTAPSAVLLGSASKGPLILGAPGKVQLWDLVTLHPIGALPNSYNSSGTNLTISCDGKTLCTWNTPGSERLHVYRIDGEKFKQLQSAETFRHPGLWLVPSADGGSFLRDSSELLNHKLRPLAAKNFENHALQPTDDPRYFLAATSQDKQSATLWIGSFGSLEKLVSIPDAGVLRYNTAALEDGHYKFQSRMRYLPNANRLVTLPKGDQEVRIIPADLSALLKEQKKEYLHVVSVPPIAATVGKPYSYALEALTNLGNLTYKLESGPEGMAVDAKGIVQWTPKAKPAAGVEQFVVSITTTGGKEVFHSCEVGVEQEAGTTSPPAKSPEPDTVASKTPSTPGRVPTLPERNQSSKPVIEPKNIKAVNGEPVKIDAKRLEMPVGPFFVASSELKQTFNFLQGDRLTIMGPDGLTPQKTLKLPKSYALIGERADYWVAATEKPIAIDIIKKSSLEVVRSVKLPARALVDLTLHPTLPIAYVSCQTKLDMPSYHFYIVDESKGDARESDEYVGTYLQADPQGRFLMASFTDVYDPLRGALPHGQTRKPGVRFMAVLFRYDLDRAGLPRTSRVSVKERPGGITTGINLSTDGNRVAYLSETGSPHESGNLSAWDSLDFEKVPAVYSGGDAKTSTHRISFHPFLPLVSLISTQKGPVVLHRDTGDEQRDRIKLAPEEFKGVEFTSSLFSPNGKQLIVSFKDQGVTYFHSFDLNLNSEEEKLVNDGFKKLTGAGGTAVAKTGSSPAAKTGLPAFSQFDALAGGLGKEMSAKDIGRAFMDSVVVVQSDEGSGTGFVVGKDGYILTCEHCLPSAGDIKVALHTATDTKTPAKTFTATVFKANKARDLALIKITPDKPLSPIRLGYSPDLETGDKITVIGNPGVANSILDYTMTEGIVSNPSREINDQKMIQLSAPINPGSSGGPMFDDHGLVVGMAVAKARIEAAGFAIPAQDMIQFLIFASDRQGVNLRLRRIWSDDSGKFNIDARLAGITTDKVKLLSADNKEIAVERSKLSKSDQAFLKFIGLTQ